MTPTTRLEKHLQARNARLEKAVHAALNKMNRRSRFLRSDMQVANEMGGVDTPAQYRELIRALRALAARGDIECRDRDAYGSYGPYYITN